MVIIYQKHLIFQGRGRIPGDHKLCLLHIFYSFSSWLDFKRVRTTVSCIWSSEPPAPRRFETVIKRMAALFRAASPFYVVFHALNEQMLV